MLTLEAKCYYLLVSTKRMINPLSRVCNGGVAERSNATDCKSVDLVYDGSNPSPSTISNAGFALEVEANKRV